jgi:hypothetical protein
LPEKKPKESDIGRCERCGKMVVFTKYTLCYECRQDEKAEVERVMGYIKDHPGATLNIVAEFTGVDPKLVLRLIRRGRIDASSQDKKNARKRK